MKATALRRLLSVSIVLVSLSGPSAGDEPGVVVNCSCQTKKNPSWCETKLGDFEEHRWNVKGYNNPNHPLDKDGLALFCKRHADAPCLCDDIKNFQGTIEK